MADKVVKLWVEKAQEHLLGEAVDDKPWLSHGSRSMGELPHERWNRETEDALTGSQPTGGTLMQSTALPEGEHYRILTYLESQGFRRGSLVYRADDKLVLRSDPRNWGLVMTIMAYKPEYLPKYKPIKVEWFSKEVVDRNYFDESELIILWSCPSTSYIIDRIKRETARRVCS